MSPIQFRRALASLGMLAVLATFAPVHAAPPIQIPIQILDPDGACASWTPGGTLLAPTLTCNKASTSTGGVPVCSVTADGVNPLTISASKLVVLSASCTNTDSGTTYTWSGTGTVSGQGASSQSLQVGATTTFSVVATNASGPSGSKSVTVTLGSTAPPPAPPPSGALSCPGYNNTYVVNLTYPLGLPVDVANFGQGDLLIARFTTPTTLANRGAGGLMAVGEYGGTGALYDRTAVLNTTPCNFASAGKNVATGSGPTIYFNSYPLSPGTTYYLHVTNTYRGLPSCYDGNCPVRVTLAGTD